MCTPKHAYNKPTSLVEVILLLLTGGWWAVWMYYRDNHKK